MRLAVLYLKFDDWRHRNIDILNNSIFTIFVVRLDEKEWVKERVAEAETVTIFKKD